MSAVPDHADEASRAADEAFLFHLSRGSEYLIANRVEEAKDELERALVVQPRDAKGQDLLAGVYFRLGLYPRAIELWGALVELYPDDVALRVNLGLVLLKTAQLEEATRHLGVATTLDPSHARAFRYLGLALYRLERLEQAREAFLRGGERSMAERMAELQGPAPAPHPRPSLSVRPIPFASDDATGTFGNDARSSGSSEPGAGSLDDEALSLAMLGPKGLAWTRRARAGGEVLEPRDGALFVRPATRAFWVREDAALAVRGERPPTARGFLRIEPGREALLRAEQACTPTLVAVARGDVVYVVERFLLAHEDTADVELRSIEVDGSRLAIVALHGPVTLALATPCEPLAIVTTGDAVAVSGEHLVGWCGRLFPRSAEREGRLALVGEGAIVVA